MEISKGNGIEYLIITAWFPQREFFVCLFVWGTGVVVNRYSGEQVQWMDMLFQDSLYFKIHLQSGTY